MSAKPFVILYVEDDDLVRESFAELLDIAERRVVAVADGAGAREALRDQNVNLLMTDLNLPDGSGLEVAREALRQDPRLPVIVCSGHDSTGVVRSLGPTAHSLRKPIDLGELEALIERLARDERLDCLPLAERGVSRLNLLDPSAGRAPLRG